MQVKTRRLTAALIGASLALGAVAPALAQDEDWPNSGPLADGSAFTLNPTIAEKVANGDPVNYVFSYGSASIPLFSPQYISGYNRSMPVAQEMMPNLVGTAIAPASPLQDANLQIAQIQALFQAGLVDCLSIQTTGDNAFTKIVNDIMATGVPVFTVGVQSNGNELTNYTQISLLEGAQAANIVLDWEKANDLDLGVYAVSGGDPPQNWAQGRMKGFVDTITAAKPDATFVNTQDNGLSTTYDPAATYDAYRAFLQGNPEVQFIENVDIGAEHANRAIVDAGREGEVYTIGWNVSLGQLDGVEQGIQVAVLDQKWGDQAAFGAGACADFLTNGNVRPNDQELLPVTLANLEEERANFQSLIE
jgi:ABC-type sugar transport system substrate-binding protein